ncbi:MAG: hypothetical protein F6J98_27950 [Moorea sp. SIO4G2]|nr:hypothetical protein [Moorena sp. SIO4G2]
MHSTRVPNWPRSILDHLQIIPLDHNLPHLTINRLYDGYSTGLELTPQCKHSAISFQGSAISYQLMGPMRRSLCHATDGAFE